MRRLDRRERGSITAEVAILAPALLVVLGLVIAAGRITVAGSAVEQGAAAAARAASIARSPEHAGHAARTAAQASLTGQDVQCADLRVDLDLSGFAAAVGTPATVSARLSCEVPLRDLTVPGMPGTRTLEAGMTSPLDRFRAR